MRKVVWLMHVSLDGFVAGVNGEMDWIRLGDEMWSYVESITNEADTAIYGEVTYHMMEEYWPHAAEMPNASEHDIAHGRWANMATKLVFSTTLKRNALAPLAHRHGHREGNCRRAKSAGQKFAHAREPNARALIHGAWAHRRISPQYKSCYFGRGQAAL